MSEGAGGGAFNGIGQARGAAFRNYDAICAGCERGTHDGAQVVRIFDSVEKNEKALRSFGCKQVFQFERGFRGGEGGDALMFTRAGEAIQLKTVLKSYGNTFRASQLHDDFHTVAVAAASDHNTVERASGGECFFYRVESS